ncbi:MAG: CoA transferase, partial [Betaproteobacteria bacterium]|nr:CoA transferase [Betaproteobacteria bacterium]
MPAIAASSALSRLRILDFSRVRAGPTCVRQFADFGADVVKIESPPGVDPNENMGGPRDGPDMQNLHRNKRAIESLARINPRIILASISGFGQDGPYRDRPGFDQIAQGMSGIMSVTGAPGEGPMRVGAAVADVAAGLFAALGIMTALLEREHSGKGQWVQSSLLNAGIALLDFQAARYTMKGDVPGQVGNDHPTSMPTSAYKTADGYINVAASGDGMWTRICQLFGRPELARDERFRTNELRAKNRAALNAEMNKALARRTSAEWIEALNKIGVPCGPIYKMDEVFADPQVKHLGAAAEVNHPRLGRLRILNQAVKLSRTPATLKTA